MVLIEIPQYGEHCIAVFLYWLGYRCVRLATDVLHSEIFYWRDKNIIKYLCKKALKI